ncbi:MAG: TolC family outer membrane protein [Pseudomonadota bacterium]|nr:TolC family outer membrane protein [Pseudomonadota bacterium]
MGLLKKKLGIIQVITFMGSFTSLLASSSSVAQTIDQMLSTLANNHPQVRSAFKSIASSKEEIKKAAAGFLPTVNITSDIGPETIDSPTTRSSGDGSKSVRSRQSTTLTVTQNLFQGFEDTAATRTARLNKLISETTLKKTSQDIMMMGVSVFIDVVRQAQLVELATQNEETIQIQLNLEDERVQTGSGIAVDVLQAKTRLQLAKERRLQFQGNMKNAITRYTRVFNEIPNIDTIVEPMPTADLIPDSLEAAINIALSENPQIRNKGQQIAVAKERKRSARSDLFPSLNFVSKFNYEKHNNGTMGTKRDASFLLQANWNLFTGLTSRANIAQASYDYAASHDDYEFIVRKVNESTNIAWQDLKTSMARLTQLENAVNIASEVFDSRQKLRAAGKDTVINVLDAKSEIINARINLTTASFNQREAIYKLLLAMGRLGHHEIASSDHGARDTLPR